MSNSEAFSGVFTALATPFLGGSIDFDSLKALVNQQVLGGVSGFVVNGTTAESPTLEWSETKKIFDFVRGVVGPKFPIVLGTGSNSTAHTIKNTMMAEEWGADGALVVVPYYNKPSQEGLYQHFLAVAKSTNLPLTLYNVPSRTITELSFETLVKLQERKNIIGVKEASGNMDYIRSSIDKCKSNFLFLSGDDGTSLRFMSLGGHGVISVVSHLIPKEFVRWVQLAKTDLNQAEVEFSKYENLLRLLYIEANPIPLKSALFHMGIFKSFEVRLPLTALKEEFDSELVMELKKLSLC